MYVIKIENDEPVGYPVALNNFKEAFGVAYVDSAALASRGYAFYKAENPRKIRFFSVLRNNEISIKTPTRLRLISLRSTKQRMRLIKRAQLRMFVGNEMNC